MPDGRHLLGRLPLPLLALLAVSTFLIWGSLTRGHNWGGDFSQYIMQAISIVEGRPEQFVEGNRSTIHESSMPIGPVAYPWGYPLLLAPVYAFFGLNVLALKAVNAVCFLIFLALFWFSLRPHHSTTATVACVGLFALNPQLLGATDEILSDIPFLLLSFAAMVFMGFVIVERRQFLPAPLDHVLLGGLIAAAFFVRSNGILLLAVLAVSQAIAGWLRRSAPPLIPQPSPGATDGATHRDRNGIQRIGVGILPYATFALMAAVWGTVLPEGGSSYADHLPRVTLASITQNFHYYVDLPAQFFEGVPRHTLVYGATIPLAFLGMLLRARADYHAIAFFTLMVVLYVVWPYNEGLRFLLPVLPFYVSFVFKGIDGPNIPLDPMLARWTRAFWIASVVVILLSLGKLSMERALENLSRDRASLSGPFVRSSLEMFSFVTSHTPPGSTIIFFKPRVMRLLTGRPSLLIRRFDQLERGDYVSLHRSDGRGEQVSRHEINRALTAGRIQLVWKNNDFEVYRLKRPR